MSDNLPSVGFNHASSLNPTEFFNSRWQEFLKIYLPVSDNDSIWRYSRLRENNDPEQGWKLHVSATILNATEVFQTVAPFLKSRNIFYKAPVSLNELKKLNTGVYYGYTQIGKFITVYPQTDEESVELAEKLHRLTQEFSSPSIPFENRYKPQSSIYYRYGAFKINWIKDEKGNDILAIKDQNGNLIPDRRETHEIHPSWIKNPFPSLVVEKEESTPESLLRIRFRVFRALTQRGKGGVYQGIDLKFEPPRFCLVKEGRKNGETEWNGRDGFWRIKHEACVLEKLQAAKIKVPEIYSEFVVDSNSYLATEFIEGANLYVFLKQRRRHLTISKAMNFAVQLAEIVGKIHNAGWLWRDCKPENLLVTKKGELRPIDFEGACSIEKPDSVGWTTLKPFAGNRREDFYNQTTATVDLYALGAIMYLLFEAKLPSSEQKTKFQFTRKNIPPKVKALIVKLLNPRMAKKINAGKVERILKKAQSEINLLP